MFFDRQRDKAVSGDGARRLGRRPAFHGLASEWLYRNVALAILFATGLFGLLRNWLFG